MIIITENNGGRFIITTQDMDFRQIVIVITTGGD